jgi:hypothetical protein
MPWCGAADHNSQCAGPQRCLQFIVVPRAVTQSRQHGRTLFIVTCPKPFLSLQLAEVKEQAERRIAKLNSALQSSESRCHQLAAEAAAAAAAAANAPSAAQPQASQVCSHNVALAIVCQPCDAAYSLPGSVLLQLCCTNAELWPALLHKTPCMPP